MRYKELVEAPIADLEVIDHYDNKIGSPQKGMMGTRDFGSIQSPKGRIKILRAFEKTNHIFNIYVVNSRELSMGSDKNEKLQKLENILGKPVDMDGKISVLLLNNTTTHDDYMPLTPWMIAHRIAHAIAVTKSFFFLKVETKLVQLFHLGSSTRYTASIIHDGDMPLLSSIIDTKACRRDRGLQNSLDVIAELFSQYLILGKIKLRPLDKNEVLQKIEFNQKNNAYMTNYTSVDDMPIDEINSKLPALELEIAADLDALLTDLQGTLVSF